MYKVAFITLGCAKNTVLTEYMMGIIISSEYILTEDYNEADVVIVNTCGFINDAKEESINLILELIDLKNTNNKLKIVVLGCLVQKYAKDLNVSLPEIDLLLGSTEYDNIIVHLDSLLSASEDFKTIHLKKNWSSHTSFRPEVKRNITTLSQNYAYLLISEGCNNRCTYCAIPEMQGPYRSRPMEDIISEAKQLVAQGYRELIIIAQDTTYYGKDLYGEYCLDKLLDTLAQIDQLVWLRLLYAYPNNLTTQLMDVIARNKNICNYIDMPLQHISNKILQSMNRDINQEEIKKIIQELRKKIPDIVIRSTFISGFPGETREDHLMLVDFLKEIKLDRVGVFPYSQEDNTLAGRMPNQVNKSIKDKRAEELMETQFDIMVDIHKSMIGEYRIVKIDSINQDIIYTRSYAESPSIDPYILLKNENISLDKLRRYFMVKITDIDGYDLIGELV